MTVSSFDPTDPRLELVQLREKLKNADERNRQLEGDLKRVYIELGRKDEELRRIREERDDLKVELVGVKKDLGHARDLLEQSSRNVGEKKTAAKWFALFASFAFFIAAGLASLGVNLVTQTPPNEAGVIVIIFAFAAFIVGAGITLLLASGGE